MAFQSIVYFFTLISERNNDYDGFYKTRLYYSLLLLPQFLPKIVLYWILIKAPITDRGRQWIKNLIIISTITKIIEIGVICLVVTKLDHGYNIINIVYLFHLHVHIMQLFELIFHSLMIWGPKDGVGPSLYPYKQ